MTQADIEKAYTEAVDQLARAVEANRLLTERLEMQELQLADVRKAAYQVFPVQAHQCVYMDAIDDICEALDRHTVPSQDEQPPASPGVPT